MAATAFVLAAGLGTRLRPLTLTTPKPLLPVQGLPMLDHALALLRRHGHEEIVVNAFWLPEQIVAWAQDKAGVTVIVESPLCLGTGGGLRNAQDLLAERFVVLNGDTLCDVDLSALWAIDAPAVMALRQQATAKHTAIGWKDEYVTGIRGVVGEGDPRYHFTGVHVLYRDVLSLVPPQSEQCVIRTVYKSLIPKSQVKGMLHTGLWVDIGTPEEYDSVK